MFPQFSGHCRNWSDEWVSKKLHNICTILAHFKLEWLSGMTELLNLVFQNNNLFANKTLLWTVCLRLWITGTVKMLLILLNCLQRPIISLYNASIYHQEPLNSGGIHFVLPIYVFFLLPSAGNGWLAFYSSRITVSAKNILYCQYCLPTYSAIALWTFQVRIPTRGPFLISLSVSPLYFLSALIFPIIIKTKNSKCQQQKNLFTVLLKKKSATSWSKITGRKQKKRK